MKIRSIFFFTASIGFAALLQAQGTAPPLRKLNRSAIAAASAIVPEDYGVQDVTYTMIPATAFRPLDSNTTYSTDNANGGVFRTGLSDFFAHRIDIPPGAILLDMTTYIIDSSATGDITTYLAAAIRDAGTGLNPLFGTFTSVASSGMPGATATVLPWNDTLPAVVGSQEDFWMVLVTLGTTDNTNSFSGVRLKWKRRVSPAPGTARFTDVPTTHAFFQYIEALAAAGITAGCGGGNYCPDAAVTRGQMAVFLARALGLHWTP